MKTAAATRDSRDSHRVNLAWVVLLRWLLLAAQAAAMPLLGPVQDIHVHAGGVTAVLILGAGSNVALALWLRHRPTDERTLAAALALDVVLLTALLLQSGAYANPLSFLYLVHVAVAAVLLSRVWTWAVVGLAVVASLSLSLSHTEHQDHGGEGARSTQVDATHRHHARLHLQGMWISFAVIAYFVTRLRRALAAREAELAAERALATRGEKIASLATLAAGAAHELATPLSTIATVAKEIERRAAAGPDAEDSRLIREEVERCRRILHQMTAEAGASAADEITVIEVGAFLADVAAGMDQASRVQLEIEPAARTALFRAPPRALTQALRSALKNALEASAAEVPVTLRASVEGDELRMEIRDHGSGMKEEVLARAGEPFFTTREPGRGMGLGLFLTRTVLERLGGSLTLDSEPATGTSAVLSLPLAPATNRRSAPKSSLG